MQPLTEDQQARLDALLRELATLPVPELIAEAGRLRGKPPMSEQLVNRMRSAFSGALAAQKIVSYLQILRMVNAQSANFAAHTRDRCIQAKLLRAQQSLDAAKPAVLALMYNGFQDVAFHQFAICVGRIERYLPRAAKASGYKLPKQDRDFLESFRPLRDLYEHLDERLPGSRHPKAHEYVKETITSDSWSIRAGLDMDNQGRLLIPGHPPIDVTNHGVQIVDDIVKRAWEKIRESAILEVRKHFEADPTDIPSPEDIRQDLLVSLDHLC